MLGKITGIFTTAAPGGVTTRDVVMTIGTILALLGTLGVLTPEQIAHVRSLVDEFTKPEALLAFGTLITLGVGIYRRITKAYSDKAAEVAKQIDAGLPLGRPVIVPTPAGQPDLIVSPVHGRAQGSQQMTPGR